MWNNFRRELSTSTSKQKKEMTNLLYIIAVILVIAWAIGFFALHAGGIIHILLVIAVISILFKALSRAA